MKPISTDNTVHCTFRSLHTARIYQFSLRMNVFIAAGLQEYSKVKWLQRVQTHTYYVSFPLFK